MQWKHGLVIGMLLMAGGILFPMAAAKAATPDSAPPPDEPRLERREWINQAWPGYEWLFATLITMRHPQGMLGLLRAELQLYERLGKQVDLLALQLGLAERLSQAPDYADQAKAIHWLLDGLGDRVRQAAKQPLPPDQQAAVKKQQADAQRAFAAFPRRAAMACLTMQGLNLLTTDQSLPQDSWPRVYLAEPGYFMFYWDRELAPEFQQASK